MIFLLFFQAVYTADQRWPENELVKKILDQYDPDVSPFDFNLTTWRQQETENLTFAEEDGGC